MGYGRDFCCGESTTRIMRVYRSMQNRTTLTLTKTSNLCKFGPDFHIFGPNDTLKNFEVD